MKINRILFIGLGGAGQRHLRIFKDLLPKNTEFFAFRALNKTPLLNDDFTLNSSSSLERKYNLCILNSLDDAFNVNPDLVVISNPTSLHLETAEKAAARGINIFIEKPFSHNLDGFNKFEKTVLNNNLCFFVSFQRRFHKYLSRVKEIIASGHLGKIINANFNVASFVPAWHPYEDFKELYACRGDLGGGVLLTEIHEIDLCYWYFGLPISVICSGGNYSDVKLNVEDTSHLILNYSNFDVTVNLSFMQKQNRRDFYIAGSEGFVEWNADGNKFIFHDYKNDTKEILSDPEYTNDAMFVSQASYFIKHNNPSHSTNTLEAAKASVAIVEAAKESMSKGIKIEMFKGMKNNY
jgi:predicted dehydrogenase